MNIYAYVEQRIHAALEALKAAGELPADLEIAGIDATPPRDALHGDVASNAALVLAKAARIKPREIADRLAERLRAESGVSKVEVAGPGFLNLSFAPAVWHSIVKAILQAGSEFGRCALGYGERVNVEYVSANPTGPMHVGHCRGAVFGDALANLLAFVGYDVTREYYINDAGKQVDALARSAYLRYREGIGEDIGEFPAGLYPGEYLKPVGQALAKRYQRKLLEVPDTDWLEIAREAAIAAMLNMIKDDLAALDVKHDVFFSERELTKGNAAAIVSTISELREKGLVFEGRLPPPKGEPNEDWEDREQTLFRSTAFGDDTDRALQKSDGSYTYFAADMAYHRDKYRRGFRHMINVFGADHAGYIKRMQAAVRALSDGNADLDIKVVQLVRLLRAGEVVKMGKRLGTFITLREVVDEVGRDSVRFMMLYRKNDAPLDFDLAKVREQSKDNPVFYVQYAHARAESIFRNVLEVFPDLDKASSAVTHADLFRLVDAGEIALIKQLALFPKLIKGAARAHEPHRLAFYLYDLAAAFHLQWTKGNDSPHLRFIQPEDKSLTAARLALIRANQQVLASGLKILGVQAPSEMR
jgi:arginyl-tRNA synthetase